MPERYNVSFTGDALAWEDYTLSLSRRFNILQDLQGKDTNIEDVWQGVNDRLKTTCNEALCITRKRKKE